MNTDKHFEDIQIPTHIFTDLTELATKHNWIKTEKNNELIYTKIINNKKKEFIFRFFKDRIEASIPLKSTEANYCTKLITYFEAVEYGIHSFNCFNDL